MIATHSISRKITSILYLMKIMPAFWMKTEFCEVMFGLRKKKLKREVFSVMSEEISPLMCRRCGTHIIYYILSCYKFHQVYMHAYLNLRSNMAVMAFSITEQHNAKKTVISGTFLLSFKLWYQEHQYLKIDFSETGRLFRVESWKAKMRRNSWHWLAALMFNSVARWY